ncbi:Domain of unknown function (DUF4110), putative, partial [Hepatocystis sp. ex Piliocolobus tephrosceles]
VGRINSHIFIINKHLYVFGGLYEYQNNEIMLNDCWKINIFKKEKWELIHKGNLDDIYVEQNTSSSDVDIGDDIDEKNEKEIEDLIISNKIKKIENKLKIENRGLNLDINENLKEFFSRTKEHWLKELNMMYENKQNRKSAFILCEQKYLQLKKYYDKIQKYKQILLEQGCEENSSQEGEDVSFEEELSST